MYAGRHVCAKIRGELSALTHRGSPESNRRNHMAHTVVPSPSLQQRKMQNGHIFICVDCCCIGRVIQSSLPVNHCGMFNTVQLSKNRLSRDVASLALISDPASYHLICFRLLSTYSITHNTIELAEMWLIYQVRYPNVLCPLFFLPK